MRITVNGTPREVDEGCELLRLLAELKLDARTTLAELNGVVVAREHLADARLREGDRLELVRFVGGG